MSERELDAITKALRHAARQDDPRPLAEARAREMVMRALVAARETEPAENESAATDSAELPPAGDRLPLRSPVSAWAVAGIVCALAAATLLALTPRGAPSITTSAGEESAEPARAVLPTGDELIASAGAEYTVESVLAQRRVSLRRGSVLCDVRPLGEGTGFSLGTPHLQVEVLGTVFSVRVEDERSDVWVYEGRVRVVMNGETRVLEAGETTASTLEVDPLAAQGRAARDLRGPHRDAVDPGDARARERSHARPRQARIAPRSTDAPVEVRASLEEVRAWLAEGRADEALREADARLSEGQDVDWLVLRADALRALGHAGEAVATLERAVALAPDRRHTIGYRIASVRWHGLDDARGALEALERHRVTEPGSALAERGLALEIDLDDALGRASDRTRAVDAYLARFPTTTRARELRRAD
jgi:ferric-dicitrate binding protein FerR (iron transport regulator)